MFYTNILLCKTFYQGLRPDYKKTDIHYVRIDEIRLDIYLVRTVNYFENRSETSQNYSKYKTF